MKSPRGRLGFRTALGPRVEPPMARACTLSECHVGRFGACIGSFADAALTLAGVKSLRRIPNMNHPIGNPVQGGKMHLRQVLLVGAGLAALAAGSAVACPD